MGRFSPRGVGDVARLVREEVLGVVTTCDGHGFVSTPLPLLAHVGCDGEIRAFVGHFALNNPHTARAQASPRAHITFLGPHGYISPAMVSAPGWGPTWNYRFAQFEVELRFEPERSGAAIVELVTALEGDGPDAWTVDQIGARFEGMARRVIAFRAEIVSQAAQFKLGQDETPESFAEIVAALGPGPLAEAMLAQQG